MGKLIAWSLKKDRLAPQVVASCPAAGEDNPPSGASLLKETIFSPWDEQPLCKAIRANRKLSVLGGHAVEDQRGEAGEGNQLGAAQRWQACRHCRPSSWSEVTRSIGQTHMVVFFNIFNPQFNMIFCSASQKKSNCTDQRNCIEDFLNFTFPICSVSQLLCTRPSWGCGMWRWLLISNLAETGLKNNYCLGGHLRERLKWRRKKQQILKFSFFYYLNCLILWNFQFCRLYYNEYIWGWGDLHWSGIWFGGHLSEWSSSHPRSNSLWSQDDGSVQVHFANADHYDYLIILIVWRLWSWFNAETFRSSDGDGDNMEPWALLNTYVDSFVIVCINRAGFKFPRQKCAKD